MLKKIKESYRYIMLTLLAASLTVIPFVSGNCWAAASSENLLASARSAEQSGNRAKAISLYRQCFKYSLVRDEAILRVATLLLSSNELDKAQSLLEEFLDDHDSFSRTARLALSRVFHKKGNFERALVEVERAEALRPNDIQTKRLKALIFYDLGQHEASIVEAGNVLKSDPNDDDTRYIRASSFFLQKKYREAINDLLYLTTKNPLSIKAFKLQAEAFYELGEYARARSSWEVAIKLEPGSVVVLERLADLHAKLGKIELATEYYQRCVGLDPSLVEVRLKLGKIFLQKGLREKARIEFEQILAVDSGYDPAQYNYLKILLDDGRYDDAGRLLAFWFNKYPEKTWLASAFARILIKVGKTKEALLVMKRNMKESEYSVDAYIATAEVQETLGLKSDAVETLHDGEKRYPQEMRLKAALVAFYVRTNETAIAERKLQEIPEEDPVYREAWRLLRFDKNEIIPKIKNKVVVQDVRETRAVASIEGDLKQPAVASTVIVNRGETLAEVSYRVYGTHKGWTILFKENQDQLVDPNQIVTGQVLRVPHWSGRRKR
jgi:tetratricopeptide (TPR) repeat protein